MQNFIRKMPRKMESRCIFLHFSSRRRLTCGELRAMLGQKPEADVLRAGQLNHLTKCEVKSWLQQSFC